MAVIVGLISLMDYSVCARMNDTEPTAVGAVGTMYFSSIIWPLSLPAMIAVYDSNNDKFCFR